MPARHLAPLLTLLTLIAFPVHAKEPVLLELSHAENGRTVRHELRGKIGSLTPIPIRTAPLEWLLQPGEKIEATTRPPDRIIELIHTFNNEAQPLCNVEIRYFRSEGVWKPAFRIDETPMVTRDPQTGEWRPIGFVQGNPALIQLIGPSLPNAEGYYSELRFNLTTGPAAITAYRVR